MRGVGIIYHREIGNCTSNYRFWLRGVNSDGWEVGPIWWVFAATLTVFLRQFRLTVTVPRRLVRTRRLFRFLHVCQYVSTFYWHNLVPNNHFDNNKCNVKPFPWVKKRLGCLQKLIFLRPLFQCQNIGVKIMRTCLIEILHDFFFIIHVVSLQPRWEK